jgi:beta-N-acetylhexosaminidase
MEHVSFPKGTTSWWRIGLLGVLTILLCGHWGTAASPAIAQTADDAFLERVVASLTVDERVGQLVMVNFVGSDVSAQSDIATLVRDFKVGAVLVTSSNGNIVNRDDTAAQLAALTNGLQQRALEGSSRQDGADAYFLPLLIATDNEGDLFPFTNVTHNYTALPNNMTIGATWSKQHAEGTGRIVGKELSAAGVNMLLGPVVDVLDNPRSGGNGDIGIRSFGGNPTWVGELGRAYVRGVHNGSAGKMITVAKHFPGHGGSDRSTDNEVPTVNKSLDQLRSSELAPFAEVDREDAADPAGTTDAMLVSHIRYRNFIAGGADPFTGPISLDAAAFGGFMNLPEFATWRSTHMVMSDSLGVPAVKKWYAQQTGTQDFPNRTVVKDALLAGNDLLPLVEFYRDPDHRGWTDYQLPVIEDSILYMRKQYVDDPAFRRRADDAVRHVIAEKLKLYPRPQLNEVSVDPAVASAAAGQGADEMRSLSEDALTLLQPPSVSELRSRLPRGPQTPEKVLIVECWNDCYPFRILPKQQLQDRLMALYGPAGKSRLRPEDVGTISFAELNAWLSKPAEPVSASVAKAVGEAAWVIFALTEYNPDSYPSSAAVKHFLDAPPVDLRNKNLIGISYNVPYHLDSTEISKLAAYFAVYSKTDAAIDTSFRALFGDVTPTGHSPVSVSGTFYSVADAVQPDPSQTLAVSIYGQQPDAVRDTRTIGLVAGPIIDRNGSPVPDGTSVLFSLAKDDGGTTTATGLTVDGITGAQLSSSGRGRYTASASATALVSRPLVLTVGSDGAQAATPAASDSPAGAVPSAGGSGFPLMLALALGVPGALAIAAACAGLLMLSRRRAVATPELVAAGATPIESTSFAATQTLPPVAPRDPPALRVDVSTRRVYVHGAEAKPALSNEQFRLLSYLYERAGKVIGRDELVLHVWPDAHAEGVSEEALDALVRRVRERLVQAGGERGYVVTLRGQGFRLEAETGDW